MTTIFVAPPVSVRRQSCRQQDLVLLADHQPGVRRLVEIELGLQGFRVETVDTAHQALRVAREMSPAIAIVEPLMPGAGLDFIPRLREFGRVPVIVLTLAHDERDQIDALDIGAEDYLTKPFNPEELSARVRSVLRRLHAPWGTEVLRAGHAEIDLERRTVRKDGELVPLSRMEWRLLLHFAENNGKVLQANSILREVWGPEYVNESVYLRVWVHRLRAIIEPEPGHPSVIRTVPRVGYRFSAVRLPKKPTTAAWSMALVS